MIRKLHVLASLTGLPLPAACARSRGGGRQAPVGRTPPYSVQECLPCVLRGESTLVSAHGNSLRALVMVLEKLSPEQILKRELATGAPVIYRLNADATVASKLVRRSEEQPA